MTIYIVDLEPVESRYTGQWKTHIPILLKEKGHDIRIIQGPDDIPSATTPGAFLNFGGTNIYKARQVEEMGRLFTQGAVNTGDHFVFTDAWHPGIINLRYMSQLLGISVTIHALWHAGSYDPQDFLGRLIGNDPWVRHAEKSFFHAVDHNYFATDFHIEMFVRNLFNDSSLENPWLGEDLEEILSGKWPKIVRSGWPMEYLEKILSSYRSVVKHNRVIFPHRIAPEKQVEIFRDLAASMPEYEWVVCQDQQLTKHEYHTMLAESKIVFSANLQETLGISCYEGMLVGAIPMVPDRLSYQEMYDSHFRYPSEWTESWDSYQQNKSKIINHIRDHMTNFHYRWNRVYNNTKKLKEKYFSADILLENLEKSV